MEFIKRHYEKLLLAGLLIMFIGSMVYLAGIMRDTGSISKEDLKIPTRPADFTRAVESEGNSPENYELNRNLFGIAPWIASKSRPGSRYQHFYSDLVVTFGAARCGHDGCERVIPMYYFGNKKEGCPWCGKLLSAPPKGVNLQRAGVVTAEDPDGCGIPHDVKRQYGLAENDPFNVLDDLDKDGFSNLYEYRQKTSLNRATSRPPMWHRLVVEKIERVKLPLQLKAVMAPYPNDKTRWDVQIKLTDKQRTELTMLNERIRIEDEDYTVKDIVLDLSEKDASGNPIDKSYIDVVSDNGVKIRMQIGKDVYTPDAKALIRDLGSGKLYILSVGQEFRVGTRRTGRSRYVVAKIDQEKKQVFLQESSRGKKGVMVPEPITCRGKIRESERIRTQSQSELWSSPDTPMM